MENALSPQAPKVEQPELPSVDVIRGANASNLERPHSGELPDEPRKVRCRRSGMLRTPSSPTVAPAKRTYAAFLEDTVDPGRPRSQDSVHDSVSEWLESVEPERPRKRRNSEGGFSSASADSTFENHAVPRHFAKSLPDMSNTRDSQGSAIPPVPSSSGRRSRQNSLASGSSQYREPSPSSNGGVRNRLYRQNNLTLNGIRFKRRETPLPDDLAHHVEAVRAKRESPGPSEEEMRRIQSDLDRLDEGCDEDKVVAMMHERILPGENEPGYAPTTGMTSTNRALMTPSLVPNNPNVVFKVSQPKPDKLYGYSGVADEPFTEQQLIGQLAALDQNPQANMSGLRFPFLCIEVKCAGGTQGDLWVAANQCAGASAACLNAMEKLQVAVSEQGGGKVDQLDHFTYAVTLDSNTAKLYISWKEDAHYYLRMVDSYSLFRPDDFRAFRSQVRNILDWGKDKRLKQIQRALDTIMVEGAKRATELAKARPMPPSDTDSNSSKKSAR